MSIAPIDNRPQFVLDEIPRRWDPTSGRMVPKGYDFSVYRDYPNKPESSPEVNIPTTGFPSMSPWTFLAGAVGNVVGGLVGNQREGKQDQPMMMQQLPDIYEVAQRNETNQLIRELLRVAKERKDGIGFNLKRLPTEVSEQPLEDLLMPLRQDFGRKASYDDLF